MIIGIHLILHTVTSSGYTLCFTFSATHFSLCTSCPVALARPPSPPQHRLGRERKAPVSYRNWAKGAKAAENLDTPKTWLQLLKSPKKLQWLKAADEEFASLLGMCTWNLVPCPNKRKIIKSKWVFKIQC